MRGSSAFPVSERNPFRARLPRRDVVRGRVSHRRNRPSSSRGLETARERNRRNARSPNGAKQGWTGHLNCQRDKKRMTLPRIILHWHPHAESNHEQRFRKPPLYPFNYEGITRAGRKASPFLLLLFLIALRSLQLLRSLLALRLVVLAHASGDAAARFLDGLGRLDEVDAFLSELLL